MTVANLTSGSSTSAGTTFTTASVAPSANGLVLVAIEDLLTANNVEVLSVAGAGLSFVKLASIGAAYNANRVFSVWAAFTDAAPSSGALTITTRQSVGGATWVVDEVTDVTLGQVLTGVASGTSGSLSYNDFIDATSIAWAAFSRTINEAITPQAGWTELAEATRAATGLDNRVETQYQAGEDTVASASGASSSTWAIVALELRPVDSVHTKHHDLWSTDHGDVDTTDTPGIGDVPTWDGSKWTAETPGGGPGGTADFLSSAKWGTD